MRQNKHNRSYKKLNLDFQHRKLKLSHSIHSIDSPVKTNINQHTRSLHQSQSFYLEGEEPIILHISNQDLMLSLKRYSLKRKHEYFQRQISSLEKDFIVISKIEEFSDHYNLFCKNVYNQAKSVHWIMPSSAINRKEIEKQFNRTYEPIQFHFLPNMASVANFINFSNKPFSMKDASFFTKIINFDAYSNSFSCILQYTKQQINEAQTSSKQLWLINEEDMSKIVSNTTKTYYFVDQFCIKDDKLPIVQIQEDHIYVITHNHQIILKSIGIQVFERNMESKNFKYNLLNSSNPQYCQKIAQRYLQNKIIYCLINFPQTIVKQFSKYVDFIASYESKFQFKHNSIFCVYYYQKETNDILGIQYNKQSKIINEIYRIKNQCQAMKKISDSYQSINITKSNTVIAVFNVDLSVIFKQIQWFTKGTLLFPQNFIELLSIPHQNAIILGKFTQTQKSQLKTKKIQIIDIDECDCNNIIIHNQIIINLQKLTKKQKSFFIVSPKIISFNVELDQFKQSPIYINKPIAQFREIISNIQEHCNHIIIMEMQGYTEEREQKLSETEVINNVLFEVYLKYGSEFIFRSKSSKYNFLKREQLIAKIKEICQPVKQMPSNELSTFQSFFNYSQKMLSQGRIENHSHLIEQCRSTPTLFGCSPQELFIIIPKTLPYHSLLNRSTQSYSLLVYNNINQIHQFIKHMNKHHFAAIFVSQKENLKNIQNLHSFNYEFIQTYNLSESNVRKKIDSVVVEQGFARKNGSICKNKQKSQVILLYNRQDTQQSKLVTHMNHIFKPLKVITINKVEFTEIKNKYQINQNLSFCQLGKQEYSDANKIRNIIDLFKIYMSPRYSFIQFTAEKVHFSEKQVFIKQYYKRSKKQRFRGHLQQINLSRSQSPKGKSFISKQIANISGLIILQSVQINKTPKREKFGNKSQLISLITNHLSKGNTLVLILTQEKYNQYTQSLTSKASGVIWIVITSNIKFCIIRESHVVFCLNEHVETVLGQITEKFRHFREFSFQIQGSVDEYHSYEESILVKFYPNWENMTNKLSNLREIKIVIEQNLKHLSIESLQDLLILRNSQKYQQVLRLFEKQSGVSKQLIDIDNESMKQPIIFLTHFKNKHFIELTLKIIKQDNYLIVTYKDLSNLVDYAQITKTLIILQAQDQVKIQGGFVLNPSDTPQSVSQKLSVFIEALRQSN